MLPAEPVRDEPPEPGADEHAEEEHGGEHPALARRELELQCVAIEEEADEPDLADVRRPAEAAQDEEPHLRTGRERS